MTTPSTVPSTDTPTPWRWELPMVLGVLTVVVGVILTLNVGAAVRTLALLVGFSLIVSGLDELLDTRGRQGRPLAVVSGIISIVAGVLSLSWPGVTLWVVALVAGVGLLMVGGTRIVRGLMTDGGSARIWLIVIGLLNLATGVLALAWPAATVLVLAVLLGMRTIFLGVATMMVALAARSLNADASA